MRLPALLSRRRRVAGNFDLVIIGAGAAGVGAARRLTGEKLSVLAVEAASRVGGRAFTQDINGLSLDLGAEWLHSGLRNPWTGLGETLGFALDRRRANWWMQYNNLGFSPQEQAAAGAAHDAWSDALAGAPGDCAAQALPQDGPWNAYVRAIAAFVSGAELERLSASDYATYDATAGEENWRVFEGFGALVAAAWPEGVALRLATPVRALALAPGGIVLTTRAGDIFARTAIVTVSTAVLAGDAIDWPRELKPWREAAALLPLGRNEKLFFEILDGAPFEDDTHLIGDPRDPGSAAYDIKSFGRPVIECFMGGAGALAMERTGAADAFAHALDELAGLFGEKARRALRPLAATHWSRDARIGGAYSYALPGCADAREKLARPFDDRLFFAGEATHPQDFTAAHGAYASGARAAEEALAALARRR
jgi:monoamine oxidase